MNHIIEAMARAHWEFWTENFLMRWERLPESKREAQYYAMRAAIRAAMECEPSEEMQNAWADAPNYKAIPNCKKDGATRDWRALLGALLGEE